MPRCVRAVEESQQAGAADEHVVVREIVQLDAQLKACIVMHTSKQPPTTQKQTRRPPSLRAFLSERILVAGLLPRCRRHGLGGHQCLAATRIGILGTRLPGLPGWKPEQVALPARSSQVHHSMVLESVCIRIHHIHGPLRIHLRRRGWCVQARVIGHGHGVWIRLETESRRLQKDIATGPHATMARTLQARLPMISDLETLDPNIVAHWHDIHVCHRFGEWPREDEPAIQEGR